VWIGIRFNLDMPLYWRIRFSEQDYFYFPLFSILSFFCGGKYPISGSFGFKVFLFNPFSALVWMSSCRPLPVTP
jgi:hypothetical protein